MFHSIRNLFFLQKMHVDSATPSNCQSTFSFNKSGEYKLIDYQGIPSKLKWIIFVDKKCFNNFNISIFFIYLIYHYINTIVSK